MCGEAMIDLFGSVPPSTDSWPLNVSSAVITKSFLGICFFFLFFFFKDGSILKFKDYKVRM